MKRITLIFTMLLLVGFNWLGNAQCPTPNLPDYTYCYSSNETDVAFLEVTPAAGITAVVAISQGNWEAGFDDLTVYEGAPGSGTTGTIVFGPASGDLSGSVISASAANLTLIFVSNSDGTVSCASGSASFEAYDNAIPTPPTYDFTYCYDNLESNIVMFEIPASAGMNIDAAICTGSWEVGFDNLTVYEGTTGSGIAGTIVFGPSDGDLSGSIISTTTPGNVLTFVSNSDSSASCASGSQTTTNVSFVYTAPPACIAPTSLTVIPSGTNATLTWTENNIPAETTWNVQYSSTIGFNPNLNEGTTVVAGANPFTLTGLTSGTIYEYYVQAGCASTWSGPIGWTQVDPPGCASNPTPVNGDIGVPTGVVTFSWDAVIGADTYDIYGGVTPALEFGLITNTALTTTSLTINAVNTTLFWQIIPRNGGGTATGCPIWSFTTRGPQVDDCGAFSSSPAGVIIDTAILSDIITVAGTGPDIIDDLNVILDINHTFVGDMVITITSPSGTNVIILNGSCGTNNDLDVTFDDEGVALICATPVRGVYIPANALSSFDGETFDGNWTITVEDTAGGDNGILNQWCLIPTLIAPPPCLDPTALNVTNLTPTSADLGWTENNGVSTWNIKWGITGFDPLIAGTDVTNVTFNPHALGGLTATTTYDFYVQTVCIPGSLGSPAITSTFAGPFTFTTPPVNDTIATPEAFIPSPEGTGCATFNFTAKTAGDGTTDSGLDGTCNGVSTGLDRFYSWTATSDALIWNDGAGNPGIVIRDSAGVEITCEGTFASADILLSGWAIGDDLIIQIYDFTTADVLVTFCLEEFTIPPPPANDTCLTATVVVCGDDLLAETNVAATDNGDAVGCTQGVGVWYKFVGDDSDVTITSTTDFDHEIGVASSADCITFTNVACQDGSTGTETVTFAANLGTDYYIYIGSFSNTSTATGIFGINVTCVPFPLCAAPTALGTDTITETTANVTWTDGFGCTTAKSVTVMDTATSTPIVGSPFTVNCGIELLALTGLTSNTEYIAEVINDCGANPSNTIIFTTLVPPPANDNCLTATVISCGDDLVGETNAGATDNGDAVGCTQGVGVWYKFVGNDMDVTITSTTDFDHEIGIASSPDCVTFTNVVCRDGSVGTETVTFSAVAGTDYYIYIGSFSDTSTTTGIFGINVACTPFPVPPVNDDCVNAEALTVGLNFGENSVVGTNLGSTPSGVAQPVCASAFGFGTGEDVWYSVVIPATGNVTIEVAQDPGSTFNDSILTVYDGTCAVINEVDCNDDEPGAPGFFSKIILTGRTPGETILIRVLEFGANTFDTFQISAYDASCGGVTKTWAAGVWTPIGAPTTIDMVIIDDLYDTSTDGNIDACTLTVTVNGLLSVGAGTFVNVINDITVDANGAFLVNNQGAVVQANDVATVTGNAADFDVEIITTVLQDSDRFTYFSSPTDAGNTNLFSGFAAANWDFNAGIQEWNYLGNAAASIAMNPAKGFAVRGGAGVAETVDFTGRFNNGIFIQPMSFNVYNDINGDGLGGDIDLGGGLITPGIIPFPDPAATDDDSNLVGNPYPSAISADDLILNNSIGAVYIWTHESVVGITEANPFADNDYIECVVGTCTDLNNAGDTPSTYNGFIASGQGFFVTATAATDLTIKNSMRRTTNNNEFRSTNKQKLWLNMTTSQGYGKQIALTFTENGTANFDTKYEARTFGGNYGLSFYSVNNANDKLAINNTGLLTNDDRVIPLGFTINSSIINDATISINRFENLENVNIYLIDNLLNVTHDLKVADYQIAISQTAQIDDRFEIVFSRDALSVDNAIISNDTLIVSNQNETQINVNMSDGSIITNIKAFDTLGKLVIDMKPNENNFIINTNFGQGQILFFKATLENGQVLTNKFMKL